MKPLLGSMCVAACLCAPYAGAREPPAPPLWTYTGETGADRWGTLSPDYRRCTEGTRQSPVELLPAVPGVVTVGISEQNQRGFYKRWAECMAAQSWADLAPVGVGAAARGK